MLLFFKNKYRGQILSGEKRDTIRQAKRLPKVGAVMQACVGPSRIFAALRITAVESIGDLPAWRRAQVEECYGVLEPTMVRLSFELLDEIPARHADQRQAGLFDRSAA